MYVDRNDIWFSNLNKNLFVLPNIHEIEKFIANRFSCICCEQYDVKLLLFYLFCFVLTVFSAYVANKDIYYFWLARYILAK